MSEHTVDVLVRARENAIRTLREVNEEIQRTGKVSKDNIQTLQGVRREIVQKNRVLSTMRLYYQDQTQTLEMTGRAFQSVASTIGKAQRMYEQYNVAMIRTNQLQQQVKDAQERYNAALAQFGPNSKEAIAAQKELQDASAKLAETQKQNVFQMLGFIAQAPSFLKNILDIKTNFQLLAVQLAQTDIVTWATNAGNAMKTFGVTATTAIKAVAFELGLLTAGFSLWFGEASRDIAKQKELQTTTGLTQEEFEMLSALAQGLGISVARLTEAIENGTIKLAQYGEEWARLEEKIKKAKQATAGGLPPPTYTPPSGPTYTPPPPPPPPPGGGPICPYCGRNVATQGHAPYCPIVGGPGRNVPPCEYCGRTEGHAPGCPLAPYVRMQRGGIVTKPTLALLGEDYKKEAVIPLDKAGGAGPTVWRIEVNVSGASSDHRDLARQIAREIISATEGRRRM